MIEITNYHWIWYLVGFLFCPKLTVMIFISLYFRNILPIPLFVIGWIFAIVGLVNVNSEK